MIRNHSVFRFSTILILVIFTLALSKLTTDTYAFFGSIKGIVKDAYSGKPIAGVTITTIIEGSVSWGSDITDPNGRYHIFHPAGPCTVTASITGYNPTVRSLIVSEFGVTTCDFSLTAVSSEEEIYRFERLWPAMKMSQYFFRPKGIAVDQQGYIYVADESCYIKKFTSGGLFVTQWGGSGSGEGQFRNPYGIAIDNSGFVYVTDGDNARIQKFTSDGEYVTQWGSSGSGEGQFDNPYGIAIDRSGFVYVADGDNHRIQRFTSDGEYVTQWGSLGPGEGQFDNPYGIAIDSSGFVYVADWDNHRIQRFTSDGEYVTQWGSYGSGEGQFDNPYGIAIDSSGFVYVADRDNHRVQKFTIYGEYVTKWGDYGSGEGRFHCPCGIAIDRTGFVYVTDVYNHRIQNFTIYGEYVTKWGSTGSVEGQFNDPRGIAKDSSGFVHVADRYNHRIQKFTSDGEYVTQWGSYGSGEGQFYRPHCIAIDSSGFVYVAEVGHRIQKFTPDGEYVTQWGSKGSSDGQFEYINGIAIDSSGFVYVTDHYNHRIQKFTSDGEYVTKWGSSGYGEGQFKHPSGIAIDSSGFVYVTDLYIHRIQKFTSDGEYVTKWGKHGTGWYEFDLPHGISIDGSGFVYVADSGNNCIKKFSSSGQYITKFEGFDHILNYPTSLCIGDDGRVYVSDTYNHRIQVYTKGSLPEMLTRAIIVAGGGPYPGNNLWDVTQMCANLTYQTLIFKGFTRDSICYLSPDTDLDLNGNGILDDVDGDPTNSNLHQAIMELALDANALNDVIIYLVGTGGSGTFRMNETKTLSASELDSWLDTLQESISGRVIFIYDAGMSGGFLPGLIPPPGKERIVITSTSQGEDACFLNQGAVSFSYYFWNSIFDGLDMNDAFFLAKEALWHNTNCEQNPLLDDNGNGVGNEPEDGALAQQIHTGITDNKAPVIGGVSPHQIITGTTSAGLFASNVIDDDRIDRVWAVIRPPDYPQGSSGSIISIDLIHVGGDRYERTYDGFNIEGTYQIAIYARDMVGNTSIPLLTSLSVGQELIRRAIIVAGCPQSDALWPAIEECASLAYRASRSQGYLDDYIYFLSPNNILIGSDGDSKWDNIYYAINTWAHQSTQDLVLYLVGHGEKETFKINQNENLSAFDMDTWLDSLQDKIPGKVTVIYDACQSWSFLQSLTPPGDKARILISSTDTMEPANFLNNGDISFSAFFWQKLKDGINVLDAFYYAVDLIDYTSQPQTPMLDDNGNGMGNEFGIDGRLARHYTIGFGIKPIGDIQPATSISPNQNLEGETSATIRVKDIANTGNMERVWAIITPPDSNQPDLLTFELGYVEDGRYEGTYNEFSMIGVYRIAVYAMDKGGKKSFINQTTIRVYPLPDSYEEDDAPDQANVIILNNQTPQHHNFHDAEDRDWVKFYGISGETYEIRATNVGNNSDPVIEFYDADGSTLLDGPVSRRFEGEYELISWSCLQDGIYYVTIRNYDPNTFGEDTGYDLEVYQPIAPHFSGIIIGTVRDASSEEPIGGAEITTYTDGLPDGGSAISSPDGTYFMIHQEGTCTVRVRASGYKEKADYVLVPPLKTIFKDFYLVSVIKNKEVDIALSAGLNLFGCPVYVSHEDPNTPGTSYKLIEYLGTKEEVGSLQRYNPDTATYQITTYGSNGIPCGDEFNIINGEGYLVYMNVSKGVYFKGPVINHEILCREGINIISIPRVPEGYTSYDLLLHLGSPDEITGIQRVNKKTGIFETTTYHYGQPSGAEFNIVNGEGYIIHMKVSKHKAAPQ